MCTSKDDDDDEDDDDASADVSYLCCCSALTLKKLLLFPQFLAVAAATRGGAAHDGNEDSLIIEEEEAFIVIISLFLISVLKMENKKNNEIWLEFLDFRTPHHKKPSRHARKSTVFLPIITRGATSLNITDLKKHVSRNAYRIISTCQESRRFADSRSNNYGDQHRPLLLLLLLLSCNKRDFTRPIRTRRLK